MLPETAAKVAAVATATAALVTVTSVTSTDVSNDTGHTVDSAVIAMCRRKLAKQRNTSADGTDHPWVKKGKEIAGLDNGQLDAADVTVYHAGTAVKEGRLVTNGGRVLGVTATAATLPEALKKAYAASESIHFDKLHKRSDIGARALAAMQ